MTPQEALSKVIQKAGGARPLAKHFGTSAPAVYQWKQAPVARVLELEKISNGEVSRHDLRPDIFGPAPRSRKGRAA